MQEIVYAGSGDFIELVVSDDKGNPIPFQTNGVNQMTIDIEGLLLSSSDPNPLISFDNEGGIKLKLGEVNATKFRSIETEIKTYSPSYPYPLGQSIVNSSRKDSSLSLVFK